MDKKILLFAALTAVASTASAQVYQSGYVQWPSSDNLPTYVKDWNNGTLNMDDENFFISRVKPHVRFRNAATQVNPAFNAENDKRLVFWVPVGDVNSDHGCNALPNGRFDSEVFSMWSYVSHYGDWTSPHGWVPGGFADAAHKNGVAVSGVASIPYGGISSNWNRCLTDQAALTHDQMAKFLHYHGVDGLGYNSEFSGNSAAVQKIEEQHEYIVKYMNDHGNPVAENIWYDGTSHYGGISFDQGLGSHNTPIYGNGTNRRASLFFNYNWGRNRNLERSVTASRNMGIDPMYIYAGFNQQGNDPGSNNWVYLSQNPVGIGLWGAHANNMFWLNRNANGSTGESMQSTYINVIERFFGNGKQNPAIPMAIKDGPCHQGTPDFFGMSAMMSAKSALNWDLAEEAFITYFNLGNGSFFNWNGQRQNNLEWYNVGVQDYLPTWRYWWAPSLLGRNLSDGDVTMKAAFTWADAYVGGSCLQITGSQKEAYLHLFKTNFGIKTNDVITVRYKLNSGKVDKLSLVLTMNGSETKAAGESFLTLADANTEADDEIWKTATFSVTRQLNTALNNKTLALIALHFQGAENLDLMLGEVSIKRGTSATPATPVVDNAKTRVLASHYKGIDGKVIFNMPNNKAEKEPVYNLDVNTSLFKLYAQAEGGEEQFIGITTSWAGMYYSAPLAGTGRVRFGVKAVSVDHQSESEIGWSEWMDRPAYTTSEEIEISKATLKPGEGFTVKYVDANHAPSKWTIYNTTGQKMAEEASAVAISVPEGFSEIGGYDVVINEGSASERRFGYFIQVSSPETGAVPEIYSIAVGDDDAESLEAVQLKVDDTVTLSYTGRDADGAGSRGIELNEKLFGVAVSELGIGANKSFSVAGWVKLTNLPQGISSFVTVENRNGAWPANNWGFFWSRITHEGKFVYDQVDTCWGMRVGSGADGQRFYNQYDDSKIGLDSWAHFAIVFECQGSSIRSMFYLNGVKQTMTNWLYCASSSFKSATGEKGWDDLSQVFGRGGFTYGTNTTTPDFQSTSYPLSNADWISFGGTASNINAVQGVLDDFQVWGKAMDDADVKASMAGLDPTNLPADVIALWDFESDPNADHAFVAKGSRAARGYFYEFASGVNEGTAGKVYKDPTYSVGCPFIAGSAYKVETVPTWTAKKATVTDAKGNATAGSATLAYKKSGIYDVTLTLSNAHGSDSRTFPAIHVSEDVALDEVSADSDTEVYSVDRTVFVEAEGTDAFTVEVYTIGGQLAATCKVPAGSQRVVRAQLPSQGVYVVAVKLASGTTRSYKLQVK